MSAVETYRAALAAYEKAVADLTTLAAAHVDAHPELDTTGEWARMQEAFGPEHVRYWVVSDSETEIWFEKTTHRGLAEHKIVVPLDDLKED